jgi:hypothetical protein
MEPAPQAAFPYCRDGVYDGAKKNDNEKQGMKTP